MINYFLKKIKAMSIETNFEKLNYLDVNLASG